MFVADEGYRIVEIDIVVGIAFGKTRDVIKAAEPDDTVNQLGIAKSEIDGVVRTKARARYREVRIVVALMAERDDLVQNIAIVLHMPHRALRRVLIPGILALAIDAIDTVQLDLALLQTTPQRGHHAHIFPLEETPHRGWKDQHPGSCMAKDQQLHVSIKGMTIPTMILTVHTTTHSHLAQLCVSQLYCAAPEIRRIREEYGVQAAH